MRAFLGIPIPVESQSSLSELQDAFSIKERAVKWVKPAQMHITLKFLGEIAEARKNDVSSCFRPVINRQARFEAELEGLGGFPSLDSPRVLWVGIAKGAKQISALAETVEAESGRLGFAREEKAFHPHLTLARIESPLSGRRVGERAKGLTCRPFIWQVTAVNFYRSHLSPAGASYEVLESFPLSYAVSKA